MEINFLESSNISKPLQTIISLIFIKFIFTRNLRPTYMTFYFGQSFSHCCNNGMYFLALVPHISARGGGRF